METVIWVDVYDHLSRILVTKNSTPGGQHEPFKVSSAPQATPALISPGND
jgi:hypothetical protein